MHSPGCGEIREQLTVGLDTATGIVVEKLEEVATFGF